MCSRKEVWHISSWLTRLIGHAHEEPDEKKRITASEAVPPDRREKTPPPGELHVMQQNPSVF